MQIYGLFTDFLRTFYGLIPYIKPFRRVGSWGGGCAEPLAWLCPDGGGAEVRPEAWGGWVVRSFRPGSVPTEEGQRSGLKRGLCGWLGGMKFWTFRLVALALRVGRVGKAKAHPVALGCVGLAVVFGFGSLRWLCGLEEVKAKSSATAGQPVTKIPKIPKIPVALDDTGEFKRFPKYLKFLLH